MAAKRHFSVTLKRSPHHWPESQRLTLASLGLTRFGKVIYLQDTPAVRGMLFKVVHVIDVTPHDGAPPPSKRQKAKAAKSKSKSKSKATKAASASA